ncbi:hypothetical protein KAFR_0H02100 [Kazachstania africana CBS 2517]|uniref:Small nuclear ribonucleoprotein Sm D3 n=1 Tax=Kazachstania africana (strain ATCC 22294 / BCRC 22015 / CBS 2517 / CECT 1963 / NBRC 1671 / NRRL Y-8276) TaxID=1071382 RepID=H2AZ63_KAZAF|nr:hypothetical protein KAFR_0H02100 [Kazachstania africana CBS 2517]CCF59619.1 hypothetical protein KAFR_0H02100 [Kazachstania africana CBS 2517]
MSSNIPIKLLNESQGHIISLELNNGDTYRGKLLTNEDNMNLQLRDTIVTNAQTNKQTKMDHVFIRGSQIKFLSLPDMLKNAPLFKTGKASKQPPPIRGPKRR